MKKLVYLFSLVVSLNSFGQIDAVNDNMPLINGYTGNPNVGNVLSNDTLNGVPVSSTQIVITVVTPANPVWPGSPVPSVSPTTGVVIVNPGTPAGTYTIIYQICDSANTSNCDQATVTVYVTASPIVANNDFGNPITSSGGIAFTNVLVNDTLNGIPVQPSQITLSNVSSTSPGVTLSGTNVVVAPGTPPGNYTLTYIICELLNPTNCDTAIVSVPVVASLSLLKDGIYVDTNSDGIVSVGDSINYTFSIINNTTGTLTNVYVTDTNATVTGNPITLNAGQTNSTAFTATHIITQADIDAGQVDNLGTVTGTPTTGPNITATSTDPTPCTTCIPIDPSCLNCTMVHLPQSPSIQITKDGTYLDSSLPEGVSVGDTIVYVFVVTNTGNVTLTNVNVTDINATVWGGPIAALAAGTSDPTTFTAFHTLTQADIDAGQVDNLATVTSEAPNGSPVTNISIDPTPCSDCIPLDSNCTTCTIVRVSHAISINGSYSDYNNDGYTNVGDVINYQYTITNFNTTNPITNITVGSSNVTISGGTLTSLAPLSTDTTTFSGVYVLTQADITNGFVTTTAIANGFLLSNPISTTATNTVNLNLSNGIKLNAFFDTNGNGVQNVGEPNVTPNQGNFYYQINNDVTHTVTSPNGMVTLYEGNPLTSYTIGFTINPSYALQYTVSPSSYSNVTVANGSGITTYNFPITQTPFVDLSVNLYPNGVPRPGFSYGNWIYYRNNGNQTIASGTIIFTVNNVVTTTSYPSGAIPNATGFTYNFTNLTPNESRSFYVYFQVPTIPTVSLGQLLTNSVSITAPPGDINIANNSQSLTQTIVGSYDPNDKQENHGGRIEFDEFTANDYLTYTIRFENTGTAEAINVRVEDVLDSQLDENSIRMVTASHDYVLDRVGSNLTWRFDGVNLPPSVPDTQIGHGFITFQIKPKAGYAIGDIIPNTAEIYFDFNPAIVTNTCTTEFVETLGNDNFAFANLTYFPNPVKNSLTISNTSVIDSVEITSILGQQMLSQKVNSLQTEIDLTKLSNGIYFVKVTAEGQEKIVKIVKE